jgi:hypothetical protein
MVCRGRHNHEVVLELKDIVVAEGALNSEVLLLRGAGFSRPKGAAPLAG